GGEVPQVRGDLLHGQLLGGQWVGVQLVERGESSDAQGEVRHAQRGRVLEFGRDLEGEVDLLLEALRPHVRGGAELRELLEQRGESALRLRDLGGADAAALERPGDQRRHNGGDFRRELVREDGAGGQHVGEQPCGGLRVQGQRIV